MFLTNAQEPAPAPAAPAPAAPAPAEPAPSPESAPAPAPPAPPSSPVVHQTFVRVFGEAIVFDPVFSAQVVKDTPGKRHYVDMNVDGKPEEVWFVDTDLRHPEAMRPLLVRVIDEDGDLVEGGEPDQDSDLYIADWKGDGVIDAAADYIDRDADQDIAELVLYRAGGALANGDENVMTAWWSRDLGDDNLLWQNAGYGYDLALAQWNSHFGGNEMHCGFVLAPDATEWKPAGDTPFFFMNRDGDVMSEENLRIEADGLALRTMRHSFDADGDHTINAQHDYDVSITARAAAEGIAIAETDIERTDIRGVPAGPFLRFDAAQAILPAVVWDRMLLTWDENDDNVEGVDFTDRHERWEGVVPTGVEGFDQVGGPHSGALNKRFELAVQTGKPAAVYFHPADHRFHLSGAKRAWLDVDANYDRVADMKYAFTDSDSDGAIDTWSIDVDADGKEDDSWKSPAPVTAVNWAWQDVYALQSAELAALPAALYALTQRLEQAITAKGADPNAAGDSAAFVRNGFRAETVNPAITSKIVSSAESVRYYLDVTKDAYLVQLKKLHDNAALWQTVADARGLGDYAKIQLLVEQEFALTTALTPYTDWIAARDAEANPNPRVGSAIDWIPDSVGWESEQASYRAYWGQVDIFGKREQRLVLSDASVDANNQADTSWGMDALNVRDTSGLGGLTLYVNGQPNAVRSPGGNGVVTFEKSLVEQNNNRAIVEMKASNVGPIGNVYTVRMRFTIEAGHRETAVEVLVEGAESNDLLELGIGLTKLVHQEYALDPAAGVMAAWGSQLQSIGTIGLGVVFPPERFLREGDVPGENHVVIKIERGVPLTYYIQFDWLRGRQYPVAPVLENWNKQLHAFASAKAAAK
ncbi:MAG: DUF4861 family protein [Candidatus Hydrogenedentes bacterium]|nr:DUF4861 family protein [Candidatus Hydrogenedentota bacterium]